MAKILHGLAELSCPNLFVCLQLQRNTVLLARPDSRQPVFSPITGYLSAPLHEAFGVSADNMAGISRSAPLPELYPHARSGSDYRLVQGIPPGKAQPQLSGARYIALSFSDARQACPLAFVMPLRKTPSLKHLRLVPVSFGSAPEVTIKIPGQVSRDFEEKHQ